MSDLSHVHPNGNGRHPASALASLRLDERGRLVLERTDGARFVGVEPVRAFPISDPNRFVVFVDVEGSEVLCLDSLDELPPDARRLVDEELALREFVPVITQILHVSGEGCPSVWDVETDRGHTQFTLDSDDDIRRVDANRVLIIDARKLRYSIPDSRELDNHSRRVLERFL